MSFSPTCTGLSKARCGKVAAAALAGLLFAILGAVVVEDRLVSERKKIAWHLENQALEQLDERLGDAFASADTLSVLIKTANGKVSGFESWAKELLSHDSEIASLQLAPKGEIRYVYPLSGNERAIGLGLPVDQAPGPEARRAILVGPFESPQGGMVVVIRQPVFLDDAANEFWGFTIALIRPEDLLQDVGVDNLSELGFGYALWRARRDSGERQVFARSATPLVGEPVTDFIDLPNGRWFMDITPVEGWTPMPRVAAWTFLALVVAFLAGWFARTRLCSLERLAESEGAFRGYFNMGAVGMCVTSPDKGWLEVNDRLCGMLGYSKQELSGKTWAEMTHPDDIEANLDLFDQVMAGERDAYELEKRFICKDGGIIHALLHVVCVRNADRSVRYFLSSLVDVTERKAAEQQLRQSARHLKESQRIAHLGSWWLDSATNEVVWTEELYKMFDADPTLPPPPYTEHHKLFTPESWARLAPALAHTQETGIPYQLELETVRSDGARGWMWVYGETVTDAVGGKVGLWGAAQDITERKGTEEALRESEARFHGTLDAMQEGILLIGRDWRYLYINKAAEMQGRRPAAELLGRTVMACWPGIEASAFFQLQRQVMDERVPARIEEAFTFPDEETRWFSWHIQPAPEGILVMTQDITERKQAEQALCESERRLINAEAELRLILDAAAEGIYGTDREGRCTFVNPAALNALGYRDPAELLGSDIHELIHREDLGGNPLSKSVCPLHQTLTSGPVSCDDQVFTRADGSRFPVWLHARPMMRGGECVGAVVSFIDITARREMEDQLRRERARAQKYLDVAGVLMVGIGVDQRVTMINRMGAEMLDYTEEEVIGHNWFDDFLPERTKGQVKQVFARLIRGDVEPVEHFVNPVLTRAGEERLIAWHNAVVHDEQGGVIGILGSGEDITERHQAEEQLRRSERRFRELVEGMDDMVYQYSTTRGAIYWSPRTAAILGYSPELMLSDPTIWNRSIHIEDRPRVEAALTAFNAGEPFDLRYRVRDYWGEWRWLRDRSIGRVNENGDVVVCGIAQDITRQVSLEQELQQVNTGLEQRVHERTEELRLTNAALERAKTAAEAANRAKSLFLANMSHELRTPLNAVLGFSEMLAQDPAATPDQQRKLGIINRSGGHLLAMINDVLDLSKIEAGAVELEPAPFDLPALLEDLGRMFELRAQSAGLGFRLYLSPGIARSLVADVGKLRQILINLLGNAIKFTPFGEVALHARTEPLPAHPDKLLLCIEVRDSGLGIPADQQQRIFDPFVQAGSTGDTKGTGLGLAITRSFIGLMGGSIALESEPGSGACFRVELPVEPAADGALPVVADDRTVLGLASEEAVWRVLVVDDTPESRLLLRHHLAPVGFEVAEAENGVEAVALFEKWHPHLIWMDMRMPVMDGFDATRRIRLLPGGDRVRIVALTAHVFKEQDEKFLEAGCDEVLHKPFRASDLFATMARLLGVSYRYADPIVPPSPEVNLTAAMLERLPTELRAELSSKVNRLDTDGVARLADQIYAIDPELAAGLRAQLDEFRFDRLLTLLGEE